MSLRTFHRLLPLVVGATLLAGCIAAPSATPSPGSASPSAIASLSPGPSGTASATPVPSASPPPTATPQPTAGPPSSLIEHGPRGSGKVALTFTMGGRAEPVVPIMEWLRDHRIPVTIFVAGSVIDSPWTDVGRTTLAMMEADPDLFEMASHGYNHPDMRTLTAAEITEELLATERTLADRGARTARPLFRPPSGYYDAEVLAVAGALGYRRTVLWDVDPIDWRTVANGGPTADEIVAKVVGRSQGGSIVLLHLSGTQTLAALPGVVDGLRAKGLEPTTVGDLLSSAAPSASPAAQLRPGDTARVSVAVATGWREPGYARPVDAPALAQPVRIREWLGALSLANKSTAGRAVARADLRAGDLVLFGSGGRVSHVAIYAGAGRIIEAPSVGGVIREGELAGRGGYIAARRVLP